MSEAVAEILSKIERLSSPDRADLADCFVETLINSNPPEVTWAQIDEVQRRIAQVESGEGRLIPGEEALGRFAGRSLQLGK